jgi:hypothetical protein
MFNVWSIVQANGKTYIGVRQNPIAGQASLRAAFDNQADAIAYANNLMLDLPATQIQNTKPLDYSAKRLAA